MHAIHENAGEHTAVIQGTHSFLCIVVISAAIGCSRETGTPPPGGVISAIRGSVTIESRDGRSPARGDDLLSEGMNIITGGRSRADIVAGGMRIRVDENTVLKVSRLPGDRMKKAGAAELSISKGRIFVRGRNKGAQGNSVKVKTPSAVVNLVRGDAAVSEREGATTVQSLDGNIYVTDATGSGGHRPVELKPGYEARSGRGKPLSVRSMSRGTLGDLKKNFGEIDESRPDTKAHRVSKGGGDGSRDQEGGGVDRDYGENARRDGSASRDVVKGIKDDPRADKGRWKGGTFIDGRPAGKSGKDIPKGGAGKRAGPSRGTTEGGGHDREGKTGVNSGAGTGVGRREPADTAVDPATEHHVEETAEQYVTGTIYNFNSRLEYSGEMLSGMKNGYGITYHQNGSPEYAGQWRNDRKHGEGILYSQDGTVHQKGRWIDDEWQGGCMSGNCDTGYGEYHYPGGEVYRGYFKKSKHHGEGTLYRDRKKKYSGGWSEGMRSGYGSSYHDDGAVEHMGAWDRDRFTGE